MASLTRLRLVPNARATRTLLLEEEEDDDDEQQQQEEQEGEQEEKKDVEDKGGYGEDEDVSPAY